MQDKSWLKLIPQQEMIEWRRHFHEYPELSFKEFKTSAYISQILQSFGGIEISHPTPTSVLGTIEGQYPGKKILLRADIDALPVAEETNLPFASKNSNIMQACGHDTHTAILLATTKVLNQLRSQLHGTVQVIFQHAEEQVPGGAQAIVNSGQLQNIDAVLGLHIMNGFKTGIINVVLDGPATTGADAFELTIQGKGSHGSMPQTGIDPITVGTEIINQLHTVTSRFTPPKELNVVTVGEFQSGNAVNVLPDTAFLGGTVRTVNEETRQSIARRIKEIIHNTCATYGATYDLNYQFAYAAVINDPNLSKLVKASALEVLPEQMVPEGIMMSGSEDFSAYSQLAPTCFFLLGGGDAAEGYPYSNHSPKFMINEKALINGVKTEIASVLNFLKN
ncbi:amidohydrolase [Lactobacillus sp. W8089]|nr:amidohydrolase [Lactobacillus sp. W8086]MBI0108136.1 amidohydrolase [Lactobacillus sp. W8085]MBI0111354.1 amidohydrolase [Lactobacillus sp. W8088]MBI0115069.1 amidohydrolase [Lactobacillus sp. W8087]MBI0118793.1 amidohydrolase [Lactobacillus sp. W8089]MBI0130759.1 amidohydrolase [Lactobacillus sp. W8090]